VSTGCVCECLDAVCTLVLVLGSGFWSSSLEKQEPSLFTLILGGLVLCCVLLERVAKHAKDYFFLFLLLLSVVSQECTSDEIAFAQRALSIFPKTE
jgi:hypothetical protein